MEEDAYIYKSVVAAGHNSSCSQELCLDLYEVEMEGGLKLNLMEENNPGGPALYSFDLDAGSQNCFSNLDLPQAFTLVLQPGSPGSFRVDNITITQTCDVFDHYLANVKSSRDYYPFGSYLPGRVFNSTDHNYGFNGKLKDDEIKGSGNSYDFGARIYDPRVGRWLSKDPEFKAQESPYTGLSNNPVWFVDPDGKDTLVMHRSRRISNMNDGMSDIYLVTFSVIRNGVEESMEEVMYMIGNSEASKNPINALEVKDNYKLSYQTMNSYPNWENTLRVDNLNVFIHRSNEAGELAGCYSITCKMPYKSDAGIGLDNYFANNTRGALNKIRRLYNQANGGDNGGKLTGDKFILKTNSRADAPIIDAEKKGLSDIGIGGEDKVSE